MTPRGVLWSRGSIFLATVLGGLPLGAAHGQGSGAVLGRVSDAGTGQAISGVTITAKNQETESTHATLAAADGIYFLAPLPPGLYSIAAARHGFETLSLPDYPVRLSQGNAARAPTFPLFVLRRLGGERQTHGAATRTQPHAALAEAAPASGRLLSIQVRWRGASEASTAPRFAVLRRELTRGSMPRQRAPELTEDQILVVAVDTQLRPRGWELIPDPTMVRAESPGPSGELSGQRLQQATADFLVTLPADPTATHLRFYHPRWTGAVWALDLLGAAALPAPPARERTATPNGS